MVNRSHLHNRLPPNPYSLTVSQSSALFMVNSAYVIFVSFVVHLGRVEAFETRKSGVARDTACRAHSETLPPGRWNF